MIFFRSIELNPEKHNEQVFKHQYVRSIVRGMEKDKLEAGDIVTVLRLEGDQVVDITKVPATSASKKREKIPEPEAMEMDIDISVNEVIVITED